MIPYELRLVDSERLFFDFIDFCGSPNPSSPSSIRFPKLYLMFSCEFLHVS